jgi:hypothetical protein
MKNFPHGASSACVGCVKERGEPQESERDWRKNDDINLLLEILELLETVKMRQCEKSVREIIKKFLPHEIII